MAQWERTHLSMQETQEMQVQSLGGEDPPGGGNGNPLQFSCLGNPMDKGAWRATVWGLQSSSSDHSEQLSTHGPTLTNHLMPPFCRNVLCLETVKIGY